MNQILAIFLPSFVALYTYEKINKREIKIKESIIKYFIFVLIINIIGYLINIYIYLWPDFNFYNNLFTIKYLIICSVIGIILSFAMTIIENIIEVNIRIDKK